MAIRASVALGLTPSPSKRPARVGARAHQGVDPARIGSADLQVPRRRQEEVRLASSYSGGGLKSTRESQQS